MMRPQGNRSGINPAPRKDFADIAKLGEFSYSHIARFLNATNVRRGRRIDCPKLLGLGLAHGAVIVFPRHSRGVTGHQNCRDASLTTRNKRYVSFLAESNARSPQPLELPGDDCVSFGFCRT